MEDESRSRDLLGIKPVAEAINTLTQGTVDGAQALLSRICLPAAEEFGLLLRDRVRSWRSNNVVETLQETEKYLARESKLKDYHAHPRIVALAIEQASWVDNDVLRSVWAGILASSCTPDGRDESNLNFIELLSQLTSVQVLILNHACRNAPKSVSTGGWIYAEDYVVDIHELVLISGVDYAQRLDRELDYLRVIGLLDHDRGGFPLDYSNARLIPTPLALHLYVKCMGTTKSPNDYFELVTKK